jgi:hypothetical protein
MYIKLLSEDKENKHKTPFNLLPHLLALGPQLVNFLRVGHLERALAVVAELVLLLRQVGRLHNVAKKEKSETNQKN